MKIQFNTDKSILGNERHHDFFTTQIEHELGRYQPQLTRVEAHVSDENGNKKGINDIRCLLEACLEGKQPIAVACKSDNIELAVSGAIEKLQASLETILGRDRSIEKHGIDSN